MDLGHPPRQIKKAICSKSKLLVPVTFSLSENKSAKETLPLLSPDSYKLIGRINMREILPVPLCDISDK